MGTIDGLPLHRTWLECIVDVLLRCPEGTSDVETIVSWLYKLGEKMNETPLETVTRTINNYSLDANDNDRVAKFHLFDKIDSATYRLVGYPNRPDLIEIQNVRFSNPYYDLWWKQFEKRVRTKHGDSRWRNLSRREKLELFSKWAAPGGSVYEAIMSAQDSAAALDDMFAPSGDKR